MKTLAKLLIMLSAAAFVAFSCEQGPELEPPVVTPEDDEEVDDAPEARPGLWDASAVTFSRGKSNASASIDCTFSNMFISSVDFNIY